MEDDRLEGMEAIREYIDPNMPKSTFYRKIRPHLDSILIEREYQYDRSKPRYFTFKNMVQMFLLKIKKL